MRKIILFLIPLGLFGQDYVAQKSTTLSSAAEKVTIQQPATGARLVTFAGAYVDCSVACTITLLRDGTAASATTLAPAKLNNRDGAGTATAWSGSNSSGGTTIGVYSVGAGGSLNLDLSKISMISNSTGANLSIATSSISGIVNILIQWNEKTIAP